MTTGDRSMAGFWASLSAKYLPFADAASPELPLGRLIRLSMFQVQVGMVSVLLIGTLNRVMIVELGVAASLVATMVALPILFAPFRALIGFRSDHHRSAFGWRRLPYIFYGTVLQFCGFAFMPFALVLLSGQTDAPAWVPQAATALAFLLVGAGMHTVQTAGLALACDVASPAQQPRVVAMLATMQMVGMVIAALAYGAMLAEYSPFILVQVIQGTAVVTLGLNLPAMWKQEARNRTRAVLPEPPPFREALAALRRQGPWDRRLLVVGLGAAAFSMQDILLEPYGGQILGLSVGATTALTAMFAAGGVAGFALGARWLSAGADPHRLAATGVLKGIVAFAAVLLSGPFGSTLLYAAGTAGIGFGGALFVVGTLTACMEAARATDGRHGADAGLVLGVWGAVQATCAGAAMALGGVLRDGFAAVAATGLFGPGLAGPGAAYGVVYLVEIALLFATLIAIGPLVRSQRRPIPANAPAALAGPAT